MHPFLKLSTAARRLAPLFLVAACGGAPEGEDAPEASCRAAAVPAPRQDFDSAEAMHAWTVQRLEAEIANDPAACGRMTVFNATPFFDGTEDPLALLPAVEERLRALRPLRQTAEERQAQDDAVTRLTDIMNLKFDAAVRQQERAGLSGADAQRAAARDYFSAMAYISHDDPADPAFACIAFTQDTRQQLGSVLAESYDFPVAEGFTAALDAMDYGLATKHELGHCLRGHAPLYAESAGMYVRYGEMTSDIFAGLMDYRDGYAETALRTEYFSAHRELALALRGSRGHNTAQGMFLMLDRMEEGGEALREELAGLSLAALADFAGGIAQEALALDYPPVDPALDETAQEAVNKAQDTAVKRTVKFTRKSFDGAEDAEAPETLSPAVTALLVRAQRIAATHTLPEADRGLGAAVTTLRAAWPEAFAAGDARLEDQRVYALPAPESSAALTQKSALRPVRRGNEGSCF